MSAGEARLSAAPLATPLASLLAALDLAREGEDRFLGRSPAVGWRRVFGGLVVAQALVAAARTAQGRPVHSLHGSFLLPGDPDEPIGYAVERSRDGGSFTTRRCVASQHGRAIFALTASFHAPEAGALDHAASMPEVPAPETLPRPGDIRDAGGPELPESVRAYFGRHAAVDLRPVDPARFDGSPRGPHAARQAVWMRASGPLPDDPGLHAAMLAYMSDLTLLDTALVAHGRSVFDPDMQAASLDHAVWFHRPVRADAWLLHVEDSPSASGALGFARGSVFARDGTLVASTAQEGLIRLRPSP